jgi:Lar family restriction alleviation protein
MTDRELLPCPFCGQTHTITVVRASEHWADEYEGTGGYDHSESYAVMCDASQPDGPGGCGASGGFKDSEVSAIDAWNRRAAAAMAEVK